MPDQIFAQFAPAYWQAQLPVIPLRQRNKRPEISQWSIYGTRMPDESEQALWLHSFPEGNIGLPLGVASGLCIIDIDTEDEALIAAILDVLPKSPWVRIGKKGMALAYRFEQQRNFKLRGPDGGMILEFLGQGNQCVVPPSIHPDTQKPYTANCNLWEVLDEIPYLGEDIEGKLRSLLGAKGVELGAGGRSAPLDVVPAGERDVQMIRRAGYLTRVVLGIDRSETFGLWEAITHMHTWVEQFTAKVSGDAVDPNKGVAKLLEFLIKDLERGRTMPRGWDAGLPEEWRGHPTIMRIAELNAGQTWTVERAKEWFNEFGGAACTDDELVDALEEIIQKLARDPSFGGARASSFFSYVKERYGNALGLQIREMKAMLTSVRKGLDANEAETHATIAKSLLDNLERTGEIRYDQGSFWQWNGSCFAKLDDDAIYLEVAEHVSSPLSRRNNDYKSIVDVLRRVCSRSFLKEAASGVNFANGFVDADLQVRAHDPKYGATFTLPFEFDRQNASKCGRWLQFLASCWGQEPDFPERVLALQEMFAATLYGVAPRYQRAFLLFGLAGTGKTQVLKVLRALLPPNTVASLGPQKWDERFALTQLIGKNANIVGELPENGQIAGSVFKEVIEGSPMPTEYKGRDGFVFEPKCAHWFASNFLPSSRDTTNGFMRRWLILSFGQSVPMEDRVENLAELIVADEREGIAAWALEGLPRLLEQGDFTLPRCHHLQTGQMRRIINSVHAFLEDGKGHAFARGSMKCTELYDSYVFHMRDIARRRPVAFEQFVQMLEELGHTVEPNLLGEPVVQGVVKATPLRAVI